MPNYRERIVLAELPDLVSKGVISEETAAAIREHYRGGTSKSFSSQTRQVVIIVAMALIGIGITTIACDKWEYLGKAMKTFLAFLPVAFAIAVSVWTFFWKNSSDALREMSAVLVTLAIGACMGMMVSIYDMDVKVYSFLLIWLLLLLPAMYIMWSRFVYGSALILTLATVLSAAFSGNDLIIGWGLAFLILPMLHFSFPKVRHARHILEMAGITFLFVPAFLLIMFYNTSAFGFHKVAESSGMAISLYLGLVFALCVSGRFKKIHLLTEVLSNGSLILSITLALFFLIARPWNLSVEITTPSPVFFNFLCWLSLLLFAALYVLVVVKLLMTRKYFGLAVASIPVFFLATIVMGSGSEDVHPVATYVLSAYMLLAAFAFVLQGFKNRNTGALNNGTIIFFIFAFVRTLDADFSLPVRGLLMIGIALSFVVAMYVIKTLVSRHFSEGNSENVIQIVEGENDIE